MKIHQCVRTVHLKEKKTLFIIYFKKALSSAKKRWHVCFVFTIDWDMNKWLILSLQLLFYTIIMTAILVVMYSSYYNVGSPSCEGGVCFSDVGWQSPPLPVGVREATSPYLAGWPKPRRVICQAVRGFWQLPSDSARCWQSYSGTGIQNGEDDVVGLRCLFGDVLASTSVFFSPPLFFNAIKVAAAACHNSKYPAADLAS